MKRLLLVLAVCATGSLALAVSAQGATDPTTSTGGAGAAPAVKKTPEKVYEWCGTVSGCGFETNLYPKTKTFGFFGSTTGTYVKGAKGALTLFDESTGCTVNLKKVKKTKNYLGAEPGGGICSEQEVELIYIG